MSRVFFFAVLDLLGGSIFTIEILVLKDKKDIVKQMLKDANMEFGVVMEDVNKAINITTVQYGAQSSCSEGKDNNNHLVLQNTK